MINIGEVIETNEMIEKENLDVRTITLGISLLDCIDSDLNRLNENIYNKIQPLPGIWCRLVRVLRITIVFQSSTSVFP